MSSFPCADPDPVNLEDCPDSIETVIIPRTHDIGGYEVRRALPSRQKRMVGPFIFWDQMRPGEFLSGKGLDVRPHPHIGLSTVTYLFDGEIMHRDSLGTAQAISPGAVNLMTAGRGIVHPERSKDEDRPVDTNLFGIQSWLALPKDKEERAPDFVHHAKTDLPMIEDAGLTARVMMGEAFGAKSPVLFEWEALYVDLMLQAGTVCPIPKDTEERALYALSGRLEIGGVTYDPNQLLVLRPGDDITIKALDDCRVMLLGGAAMDGPRHIWWNFVSSDKDRIEQAKADWKNRAFDSVPGDDEDFIPLPEV